MKTIEEIRAINPHERDMEDRERLRLLFDAQPADSIHTDIMSYIKKRGDKKHTYDRWVNAHAIGQRLWALRTHRPSDPDDKRRLARLRRACDRVAETRKNIEKSPGRGGKATAYRWVTDDELAKRQAESKEREWKRPAAKLLAEKLRDAKKKAWWSGTCVSVDVEDLLSILSDSSDQEMVDIASDDRFDEYWTNSVVE